MRGILPDTFYVGIEGKGNYTGTLADTATTGKTWAIKDATLNAAFAVDEEFTYTGYSVADEIEKAVSITGNEDELDLFEEEFEDYKPEITYYEKTGDNSYKVLKEAPVDVGEYRAVAKFEAEGFTFSGTTNGTITKDFKIVPCNRGYIFDFTKTYGDSDIEIPEEKKLEYNITELLKESTVSRPVIKALLEKGYVLLIYKAPISPIDDQSETITYPVYVAKGKVSVKAEDINKSGKYLNAGEHTLDCSAVEVGTVEVTINRETNEVTIGDEFAPTKNVTVDGTVLTVDKLKLTKDMFKASTALIVDGKADLTKIVSVADDYTDLMKDTDYEVVGNQSTAVTGTTNVQITATSEGNFKGTAKVSANVAATSIKDYAMYDSEGRIVFNYENSYGGKDNATYGVLLYRDGTLDTDMTVETAGVTNATKSAAGSFLVRDIGKGVYVRTYVKIGNDYVYGDQIFVKYIELASKTSITNYTKYDNEGRIVFSYENSYGGKDNATYGVLLYRDGTLDTDMTVETAGVTNATKSAAGSFLVRDIGKGVYVRTYVKIGNDYVYGDQIFVKYANL